MNDNQSLSTQQKALRDLASRMSLLADTLVEIMQLVTVVIEEAGDE